MMTHDSNPDMESLHCERSPGPNMVQGEAKQSLVLDTTVLQLILKLSQEAFSPRNPVLVFNPFWRGTVNHTEDSSAKF
jgi:hypothetical protein